MEENIRIIDETVDLKKVLHPISWDVMKDGISYQAFFAYDDDGNFNHTLGGPSDYAYVCPRGEEPTLDNIIAYNGTGARWGLRANEHEEIRNKWDELSMETRCSVDILRNDEVFNTIGCRDMFYGIAKAQVLIEEYKEHSLELNSFGFDKKCVGRKIRYNGVPGVITRYVDGQACVIVKPLYEEDASRFFADPHKSEDEYIEDFFESAKTHGDMKVEITSEHIWWWYSEN